jgi:hypothetical protein
MWNRSQISSPAHRFTWYFLWEVNYTVAYISSARAGEPEKPSLQGNGCVTHKNTRAIAKQYTKATMESILEAVFSFRSSPKARKGVDHPYVEAGSNVPTITPRVIGDDENVTQSLGYNWATVFLADVNTGTWPTRMESLKSETVKYGHESRWTPNREWLRWRGPAGFVNDSPVLSWERAPYINKLWQ